MSLRRQAVQGPPGGMSVTYASPSKPSPAAPAVPSKPGGSGGADLAPGAYRNRPWLRKVHARGGPEAVQAALARRRAQMGERAQGPQQPESGGVDEGSFDAGQQVRGRPAGGNAVFSPGMPSYPGVPDFGGGGGPFQALPFMPNVTLAAPPALSDEKQKAMMGDPAPSYPGFRPNQPPAQTRPPVPSSPQLGGPPMPPPSGAQEPAGAPPGRPPLPPPMPQPPPGRPPQMSSPVPAPMPQVGLGKPQTQPMPVEPGGAPSAMPPQLGPAMQELVSSGQVPPWMVYQRMQQQSGGGLGLHGSGPRYM